MPPVGAALWRSLRAHQVYGANTDVGKTIVSTVLCNAIQRLNSQSPAAFLKPVSTGPLDDADDRYDLNQGPQPQVSSRSLLAQTHPALRPGHADQVSVPIRRARQPTHCGEAEATDGAIPNPSDSVVVQCANTRANG